MPRVLWNPAVVVRVAHLLTILRAVPAATERTVPALAVPAARMTILRVIMNPGTISDAGSLPTPTSLPARVTRTAVAAGTLRLPAVLFVMVMQVVRAAVIRMKPTPFVMLWFRARVTAIPTRQVRTVTARTARRVPRGRVEQPTKFNRHYVGKLRPKSRSFLRQ